MLHGPFLAVVARTRRASEMGLSCKNELKWTLVFEARTGPVSGRDQSYQGLDPEDVHDPRQVVGQSRKSQLGGDFWKCFGQEVCRPHSRLHRAEWMLDGLATLAHSEQTSGSSCLRSCAGVTGSLSGRSWGGSCLE